MGIKRSVFIAAAGLLLATVPGLAHHRIEAQFDPNRPVMLRGTVTRIAWINPHVEFFVEVMDTHGTANWTFEMGSPNQQLMKGWKIDTLKQGDHVLIDAYPARDGSNLAYATKVTRTAH
jgi:hypothetical protein